MKIRKLSFENFRSFRDTTVLDDVKPVSTFVGSNSAGKSNIIEILSLLREMAKHNWRRSFTDLTFDRNKKPIVIEIEFELSDDERKKVIDHIPTPNSLTPQARGMKDLFKFVKYQAKINEIRCLDEHLYVSVKDTYVDLIHHLWTATANDIVERRFIDIDIFFHTNRGSIDTLVSLQHDQRSNTNSDVLGILEPLTNPQLTSYLFVKMIIDFLQQIRIFGAHRMVNPNYAGQEKWELLETGENLIEVMSTLLGENDTGFAEIMNEYSKIVGTSLKVNVPPSSDGKFHTVKIGEGGLMTQTDFLNISTGLHEALILILAIKKSKENEIICIEEPEIHLHSSAQKRLFRFIIEHSVKNQFFITTHSPIFTGISEDVSTYLVTKAEGKSQIILIDDETSLKLIKQQLGIRNSDTFGSDYAVFVEGDSEEYALPIVARAFGYTDVGTDVGNRIRIINLRGNGIIPKLEQFLCYLNNSDIEVFLIADGNKKVSGSVADFISKGILKLEHSKIWRYEFEDTFENNRIIEAMKKLAQKYNFKFTLNESELQKERSGGKTVVDILQKHLHDNSQPDLDKPKLAERLAHDIVDEISSVKNRTETEFEKEVKRILEIISSIDAKVN